MKLLVISPDFPYPPNHGGRVDMWERLKVLSRLAEVDLIACTKEMPDKDHVAHVENHVSRLHVLVRQLGIKNVIGLTPYQVKTRDALKNIKLNKEYDVVILEGEYVGAAMQNKALSNAQFLLRIHNDEPLFFSNLAKAASGPKKLYYLTETIKFKYYCQYLQKKVDALLYISREEFLKAAKDDSVRKGVPAFWLPAGVKLEMKSQQNFSAWMEKRKPYVLFVSSLFMPNNTWGISWYIKNVHPLVKKECPGYKLIIAGNTGGKNITELLDVPVSEKASIELEANPTDQYLRQLYNKCMVFVAPIFHGAGVKLKIINALIEGMPVVTTPKGSEGSGLLHQRHLLEAERPDDFASQIIKCLKRPQYAHSLAISAQEFIESRYNQEENLKKIFDQMGWMTN